MVRIEIEMFQNTLGDERWELIVDLSASFYFPLLVFLITASLINSYLIMVVH